MSDKIDLELAGQGIKVVKAGDAEWEERLVRWNKWTQETTTRIIAVPKNAEEVSKVVNWARDNKQTNIAVRAGGHGFFSAAEVVIDLRDGFSYASVDETTGIATIGMGQTLKSVDEATHPWHAPLGVVSHTGTGLMLTGGVGYLTKAYGPTSDNIREVTIVTSDGKVHVCSAEKESDLFFAVRGAAPNLGVVTEVKCQAYKQPDALVTLMAWPLNDENVQRLFNWADSPDVLNNTKITPYIAMIPSPDFAAHLVALHLVCITPAADDEKVSALVSKLKGTGELELLPLGRVDWSVPQTNFDASMAASYWYVSQMYYAGDTPVPENSLKVVAKAYGELKLGPLAPMVIYEQRGASSAAYHKVASDACAQPRFGQRWECYVFFSSVNDDKDDAEAARKSGRAMKAILIDNGASAGGRVHFTKDEPSRAEFYYGPNTDRVREVVAKYDPARLFASCNGMDF